MEFLILGSLEARRDGELLPVSSTKERLLLAALLLDANRIVSTDRLVEVLWGGDPPASATNTLQTYVSHLRRLLEPDRAARAQGRLLQTRDPGYLLSVQPEAIDAVRFERLVRQGSAAMPTDPQRASDDLRAALQLWRGDPLADVSLEPFAQPEIVRLAELGTAALCDRVDADLALGQHGALCAELVQAVDRHPLHERLWGQLILARYRSGRHAEAISAFGELRAALAEQLGVDPSPELVRLHEAVLARSPQLDRFPAATEPPVVAGTARAGIGRGRPPPADPLDAGRRALAEHDWHRAFELLAAVDADTGLSAYDLDGLAEAALWVGHFRESVVARQRAHQAFSDVGQARQAARTAVVLALQHAGRRRLAVAGGWFHRAERLFDDEPDCLEHGYLAWAAAMMAVDEGDHDAGLAAADSTYATGRRFGSDELQAVGLGLRGQLLVRQGQLGKGSPLLDEAMAMAVGGGLPPLATAMIFCRTIETCYDLGDYRRAAEWTEAIDECTARTGLTTLPGDCAAHRVACLVGRGAWQRAEHEARRAAAEAEPVDLRHVALAFAGIGDIKLRVGDLDAAQAAFDKAEELGASPLPGRARLALARGDAGAAAGMLAGALADERSDRLARSRLLPDQVTVALAVGDVDTARSASSELTDAAQVFGSCGLRAAAETASGALALAAGNTDPVAPLRRGVALWVEAGSPYESSRAQVLLAAALRQAGQHEAARYELSVARSCFERLGAGLDQHAVAPLPTAS